MGRLSDFQDPNCWRNAFNMIMKNGKFTGEKRNSIKFHFNKLMQKGCGLKFCKLWV